MMPSSPSEALGSRAPFVRDLVVEVVGSVHKRFAEAHQVSRSRYAMDFGTQWRDLLAESQEAFAKCGFESHKLVPAGYRLPVVSDCLLYVWRKPDSAAESAFASSQTKKNSFGVPPLDPMLFEPDSAGASAAEAAESEESCLERLVRAARDVMPLILVIVRSSPRQLQSIEWAVAELDELDESSGRVQLRGQECIWRSEPVVANTASDGDSFDRGIPVEPTIEPREQEGIDPDAR